MQTHVSPNDCSDMIMRKVASLSESQQLKVLEFVEGLNVPKRSIWDKLDDRLKSVPQEELNEIPADASANLEHYLYGSPKK